MEIFIVQENNMEFQGDTSTSILACFYKKKDAESYIKGKSNCFIFGCEIF